MQEEKGEENSPNKEMNIKENGLSSVSLLSSSSSKSTLKKE